MITHTIFSHIDGTIRPSRSRSSSGVIIIINILVDFIDVYPLEKWNVWTVFRFLFFSFHLDILVFFVCFFFCFDSFTFQPSYFAGICWWWYVRAVFVLVRMQNIILNRVILFFFFSFFTLVERELVYCALIIWFLDIFIRGKTSAKILYYFILFYFFVLFVSTIDQNRVDSCC